MADTYVVTRSREIAAPADQLFALLQNLKTWEQWSPWEGIDPNLRRTYAGPDEGVGASYHWEGNKKAGVGTMTITAAESPRSLVIDLHFDKPFKAENEVRFTLSPQDEKTLVVWEMQGTRTLFFKVFGFLFNFDKMVGPDFEKGLAQLAAVAET